jgi:MFS transporter, DHA2 family, multidrug resistance protein
MNPAEDGLPKPQRYWAILTLMVGLAMSCLDTAIVNVALPSIAKDLHTSAADSIWVVNAYQLAVMISLRPLATSSATAASTALASCSTQARRWSAPFRPRSTC